jgi:hypothetical protein
MPKENPVQKLEEKFIVNLHEKDFCVYEGVLNLAHKKKLKKLEVQILQYPSEENNYEAICQATAETESGAIFSDIGNANKANVNSKIIPHILSTCSTRAKSRVLRDLTNIGIATVEELGDIDSVIGAGKNNIVDIKKKTKARTNSKSKPAAENNIHPISGAQERAVHSLAKKRGLLPEDIDRIAQENYGSTVENLSTSFASGLISLLQKSA